MKVIVRCAHNRVTKADMEREIERLFQENKDLHVYVGHLRDELNLAQQQSEARRQVIYERDKLIQELNDQIAADEEELAESESESSQGISAVVKFWEEAVNEKNKAEERAEEYRIALMESDCRVDELEKELDHYKKAASIWQEKAEAIQECREKAEAELRDVSNRFIEMYQEKMDSEKEAREIIADLRDEMNDRNARVDEVQRHNDWLQNEVARLTYERDTAVNENTALTFDVNDLRDALDVEKELRSRAEHEREEFREKAGKYLDERNAAWDANKRLSGNEETITHYQEIADRRKEQLDEAMRTITSLNDDIRELEETIDGLNEDKREYAEEIDRLRKVVTNLQSTRFTTDEFIRMIARELMPSTGNGFADSLDF